MYQSPVKAPLSLYQPGDLEANRLRREYPNLDWVQVVLPARVSCEVQDASHIVGSIEWTKQCFGGWGLAVPFIGGIGCQARATVSDLYYRKSELTQLRNVRIGAFIKPNVDAMKLWDGCVATNATLKNLLETHDPDLICEVQEPVSFTNEWRLFFSRTSGRMRLEGGAKYPVPYDGIRTIPRYMDGKKDRPSPRLQSLLEKRLDGQPYDGITIDVGLLFGRWAIVEIGDVYGMGTYGAGAAYLATQSARMAQLGSLP